MPFLPARQHRRGHRETPVAVAMVLVGCVAGSGVLRMMRDARRAQIAQFPLELADRLGSFLRGCAWGALIFAGLLAALIGWGLIAWWMENWRWKRSQKRSQKRENRQ